MISFACSHCARTLTVADSHAGKDTKCPHGGELVPAEIEQEPPPPSNPPNKSVTPRRD
jgi:phage FluMu protein Com